jgi:hypothetical protein
MDFSERHFSAVWRLTLGLIIVSIIWFVYDFASFSFDTFSSAIINKVVHHGWLHKTFGWNIVFNLFSLPGCLIGSLAADYIVPRLRLALGMGFTRNC